MLKTITLTTLTMTTKPPDDPCEDCKCKDCKNCEWHEDLWEYENFEGHDIWTFLDGEIKEVEPSIEELANKAYNEALDILKDIQKKTDASRKYSFTDKDKEIIVTVLKELEDKNLLEEFINIIKETKVKPDDLIDIYLGIVKGSLETILPIAKNIYNFIGQGRTIEYAKIFLDILTKAIEEKDY